MSENFSDTQQYGPPNPSFVAGDYERLESGAGMPWAHEELLRPDEEYALNTDYPLEKDPIWGARVAAVIVADRDIKPYGDNYKYSQDKPDTFVLLDIRDQPKMYGPDGVWKMFGGEQFGENIDYLLINSAYDPTRDGSKGFKGIRRGETVDVGRANEKTNDRFNLQSSTSHKHFRLTYDEAGQVIISDQGSTNGTQVFSGAALMPPLNQEHQKTPGKGRQWGVTDNENLLDGNAHIFNVDDLMQEARAKKATEEQWAPRPRSTYAQFEQAGHKPGSKRTKLPPGTPCIINTDKPIETYPEFDDVGVAAVIVADEHKKLGEEYDMHYSRLGEPVVGSKPDAFVLLDLRMVPLETSEGQNWRAFGNAKIADDVDFLLINKDWRFKDSGLGFMGLRRGETLDVGRLNPTARNRFSLKQTTSGDHFRISYDKDGQVTIEDLNSTQGTSVTTADNLRKLKEPEPELPKDDPVLNRLSKAFDGEIKDKLIAKKDLWDLITELKGLKGDGPVPKVLPKKAYRDMVRKYHPDVVAGDAQVGTPKYNRATAIFKALDELIPAYQRDTNKW